MNKLDQLISKVEQTAYKDKFKAEGYFVIEEAYPFEFCKNAMEFIDSYQGEVELNYNATEQRIWDAHLKDEQLKNFSETSDELLSSLFDVDSKSSTLLAIRNRSLTDIHEAVINGRWHVDSFRKQVKVFLFLSDVNEMNGPFEFIPGTHRNLFKYSNISSYFQAKDLLSRSNRRAYQRFNDGWINQLETKGYRPIPFVCKAGTLLVVDTSAIHRARPCLQGARYALTNYYPAF